MQTNLHTHLEILVRELLAVDGLATGTVAAGEVTTLAARDHRLRLNMCSAWGNQNRCSHQGSSLA